MADLVKQELESKEMLALDKVQNYTFTFGKITYCFVALLASV